MRKLGGGEDLTEVIWDLGCEGHVWILLRCLEWNVWGRGNGQGSRKYNG